jgi:hypothetical protein
VRRIAPSQFVRESVVDHPVACEKLVPIEQVGDNHHLEMRLGPLRDVVARGFVDHLQRGEGAAEIKWPGCVGRSVDHTCRCAGAKAVDSFCRTLSATGPTVVLILRLAADSMECGGGRRRGRPK